MFYIPPSQRPNKRNFTMTMNSIYNLFMAAFPSSRTQWSTYLLIPLQAIIKKVIIFFIHSKSLALYPHQLNRFFVSKIYFILFLCMVQQVSMPRQVIKKPRPPLESPWHFFLLNTFYQFHHFITWTQLDHWLFPRRKNCQHNCSAGALFVSRSIFFWLFKQTGFH